MQRSITKTRGQLERITYKINELKSKYILDSTHQLNVEKKQNCSTPQKQQFYQRSPMTSHPNIYNEIRPKQTNSLNKEFKMFRNQIYQYIDKCLMNREKETPKLLKKRRSDYNERIEKIEEELTTCLSTNEEIIVKLKKNEMYQCNRFEEIEQRNIQQIAKQSLKIQVELKQKVRHLEDHLGLNQKSEGNEKFEEIKLKIQQNIIHLIAEIKQSFRISDQENRNKFTTIQENYLQYVQKIGDQIDLIKTEIHKVGNQQKQQFLSLNSKTQNIQQQIQNLKQLKQFPKIQSFIHENSANMKTQLEDTIKNMNEQILKIIEIKTQRIKSTESHMNLLERIQQMEKLAQKIKENTSKMVEEKNNQIDKKLIQISSKIQEVIQQKIRQQKSFDEKLKQSSIFYDSEIKNFKLKYSEEMKKMFQKIQDIQEKCKHQQSEGKKEMIEQTQPQKKTIFEEMNNLVDQKLNQFESDINETLKLLYDDFDLKVQEVFSGIDIHKINEIKYTLSQLREQINWVKLQIDDRSSKINQFQSSQQKLSDYIGQSVEKLSNIVEQTVEQMETKMEKLDQNFHYIYEKLSKIEFDNASFKDEIERSRRKEGQSRASEEDELIELFGSLSRKGLGQKIL